MSSAKAKRKLVARRRAQQKIGHRHGIEHRQEMAKLQLAREQKQREKDNRDPIWLRVLIPLG